MGCLLTGAPRFAMELDRAFNVFVSIIFDFFVGLVSLSLSLFKAQSNSSARPTLSRYLSVIYDSEEWRPTLARDFKCEVSRNCDLFLIVVRDRLFDFE